MRFHYRRSCALAGSDRLARYYIYNLMDALADPGEWYEISAEFGEISAESRLAAKKVNL